MRATASAAARPVPAVRAAARTGRAARRTRAAMAGASPPAPRRWVGPRTGNLAKLALEHAADVADDAPLANGFVRVDVHAIGLNFADVFTCLGLYAAAPKGVPYTPGLECCGVVASVGQGVAGDGAPKVGDRVMCVTRFGGFAERIDLPWQQALPLPDTWSFEEGAAFPVQAITAFYAMDLGGVADGARNAARATPPIVLVHSAAGGTGLAACHIAKRVHARAIMTVGTERKVEFLQSTFPHAEARDIIVRTSARDFPAQLQSAAPDGIDAALDSLGGEYFRPVYDSLAPCGRHVVFGAADWTPQGDSVSLWGWLRLAWSAVVRKPTLSPMDMPGHNKGVLGFNLIWLFDRVDEFRGADGIISKLLSLDLPPPHVGTVRDFSEAQQALRDLQGGKTVGKVVLRVERGIDSSS